MDPGPRLGIDYGSSNTVVVIADAAHAPRPVIFDGSPLLPSAVFAESNGTLSVGRDALQRARLDPGRFEPSPKRRVDEQVLLLGTREIRVTDLIAATLRRAADEATLVAGGPPAEVTLTCPAAWGATRRLVLLDAAQQAGLGQVTLLDEPVAAARYFAELRGTQVRPGSAVVVYDLGAGTFDASVVRRSATGFDVLATDGRTDIGGLDLDALLVQRIGEVTGATDPKGWASLTRPTSPDQLRYRRQLWEDVRAAKERLSSHATADVLVPVLDVETHLTREEFERLVRPMLEQTVRVTQGVIRWSKVPERDIAGVFLVGGSSRVPLAATMLHQALGIAPTVRAQPEFVVAEGALTQVAAAVADALPVLPPVLPAAPQSPALPPVSPHPVPAAGLVAPGAALTPGPPRPISGRARPVPPNAAATATEPPAPADMPPAPADVPPSAPDLPAAVEPAGAPRTRRRIHPGPWLLPAGTALLALGVALPWAQLVYSQPLFGITEVAGSVAPAVVSVVLMVAAILALRMRAAHVRGWLVPTTVAVLAALVTSAFAVPILVGVNDLASVAGGSSYAMVPNRVAILLTLAGAWCLAAVPMVASARLTVFGDGLTWPADQARRARVKRILAGAAAVAAVLDLVVLWIKIDPEWSTEFRDHSPAVAPWGFRLITVAFVAVVVELAVSRGAGRYQRWLNPVRAGVIILYAAAAGEGSGYLHWFGPSSGALTPWVTVAPTVLAVAAVLVLPRRS
jgi:Ethanolamine utilization protein EutJ (predicted chaperonin)